MKEKIKKVLLIVNPCSGKTKTRISAAQIMEKFSKQNFEFTTRETTCQGDATNIVKNELNDHDIVVCCGGDGTLNETINGVMDMPRRAPIGYFPSGTTCDLATTLGIPANAEAAADIIKKGNINDYDIGLFNNRYFSYIASFGALTKNTYATPQKLKNRLGHTAYVLSALQEIKDIHGIRMRVEHDGGVEEGEFCFGSVSNSTSIAGIFPLRKEDVRLNDGVFEVFLVRKMSIPNVARTVLEVRNQVYNPKRVLYLRTSQIRFSFLDEDVSWTLDGEYGGTHREVMIHILERAVKLITPENPLFIKHNLEPKAEEEVVEETDTDETTV
ncbi:MAG: YegS/Rv2252/BmrU family lipid kinase [Clostridia bacterium]|nr:YegS/Rv2252/BmrU family lipid kinase [Clostridia bacterium]